MRILPLLLLPLLACRGEIDDDGDGFLAEEDCDDAHADVNPDATEICNGVDDDCNGTVDDVAIGSRFYADADGDGYGDPDTEIEACDAPEGYIGAAGDCDDSKASISPAAVERCNGIDDDCNDLVDDDPVDEDTFYADADGDGHGDADATVEACEAPDGHVTSSDDCDDDDATAFPGGEELCDGADDDCDGTVDEDATDAPTWYQDADDDGFGTDRFTVEACEQPAGHVASSDDCDDLSASTHPGAEETCDLADDDCDGEIDEEAVDAAIFFRDGDGDGYGLSADTTTGCVAPDGYAEAEGDCDDASADTHPGAAEACNGIDDDCDGVLDDGLRQSTFFADSDGDGAGNPDDSLQACAAPAGRVDVPGDCDDGDRDVHTGAVEACEDGKDNDCDGFGDCEDVEDCKEPEPVCWDCGDGILDPDEECDDGNDVDDDQCANDCTGNVDLTGVYDSYESDGRMVYVWKSVSEEPISTYDTFCEEHGLEWFTPDSQGDAQKAITTLYNYDSYHTWIITKNTTSAGTWGGYSVTVDSPSCVKYSTSGFSGIRKWGCSYCEPDEHGKTECWDSSHTYDWLVCEGS